MRYNKEVSFKKLLRREEMQLFFFALYAFFMCSQCYRLKECEGRDSVELINVAVGTHGRS